MGNSFAKGLFGATCMALLALLSGCHVWKMVSGEFEQAENMLVEPFRSVTVMTWNLHAGKGTDGVRDISRAAAVIAREKPDLVALQEIDRKTERSGGVDQLAELERLTGYEATWCKTLDFQGGEYGIALLSRQKPSGVKILDLPGKGEARKLLLATFPKYDMGVTHLSLKEGDRLASIPVLRGAVDPAKPLFLAGDWNVSLGKDSMTALRQSFSILSGFDPTFPAGEPTRCIDYVAVSLRHRARFEHVSHKVLPEAVISDHRPVVTTVR